MDSPIKSPSPKKKALSPKPEDEVIDLSNDFRTPSSKPSAAIQLAQLKAIREYNSALPKKRVAKDSLPEIPVSNVVSLSMIKRDLKKKTMEIIPNYRQVGILEGTSSDGSVDRFSLANCQRELQRSAS